MRIGNYFIGENKILWLSQIRHAENVKEWSYKGWHEETKQRIEVNFFEAEPINLSPEILEKCGFEKGGYSGEYFINLMGYILKLFEGVEKGVYFPHYIQLRELSRAGKQSVSLHRIEYLHQLQNLYYCLVGEELKVNLTEPQLT